MHSDFTPFQIFSWERPFLPALKELIDRDCENVPGAAPLIIAPTSRPWEFIKKVYAQSLRVQKKFASERKHSLVLPKVVTMQSVVRLWHASLKEPLRTANSMDAVGFLYEAVQALPKQEGEEEEGKSLKSSLESLSLEEFYPWGEKLYDLVEEMLENHIEPSNIQDLEGEVLPYATKLLESLGLISKSYLERLRQNGFASRGLMRYEIAEAVASGIAVPASLSPSPARPIYIAGFHTLTKTEDELLKALWKAGAKVCLHSDPATASKGPVHWICARHRQWIKDWEAEAELFKPKEAKSRQGAKEEQKKQPEVSFLSAYDLHSQLGYLASDLEQDAAAPDAGTSVVILSSPSLLMPVLHHLPSQAREEANITMGFSLSGAPLAQFIRDILALHDKKDPALSGSVHWESLIACLSNPFLGEVLIQSKYPARRALRRCCAAIRGSARRFVNPYDDVIEGPAFDTLDDEKAVLGEIFSCIEYFSSVSSLKELGDALEKMCDFFSSRMVLDRTKRQELHDLGEVGLKENFKLNDMDSELIYRLRSGIINSLKNSGLAEKEMGHAALSHILDKMLTREHVFFAFSSEAGDYTKVAKLQLMGVLETSLLHFDNVYLLDATDDRIPGNKKHDPLLPDTLRSWIGLPDLNIGDQETGYALHRLCSSAKRIRFYWQEGVTRTLLFDGKKARSRFVEEYMWNYEKRTGKILDAGEAPFFVATSALVPESPKARAFQALEGSKIKESVHEELCGRIDPSSVNAYLVCPAKYAFGKLAGIGELESVNEGDDPSGVGRLVHSVLEEFHGRRMGQGLADKDDMAEELYRLFMQKLYQSGSMLPENLPPDSFAYLKAAAKARFYAYAKNQKADTTPLLLESTIEAPIDVCGRRLRISGVIDRLDKRKIDGSEKSVILDYKTGSIKSLRIHKWLWEDEEFFSRIDALTQRPLGEEDFEELDALVGVLRKATSSLQLPFYISIAEAEHGRIIKKERFDASGKPWWIEEPLADAAFVDLSESGEEVSFFSGEPKEREEALSHCPQLVRLILAHMLHATTFKQRRGDHCEWCPFTQLCKS